MKIGYLLQAGVPNLFELPPQGPAVHVLEVCRALQGLGHDVRLLVQQNFKLLTIEGSDLEKITKISVPHLDRGFGRLVEKGIRGIQSRLRLPYAAFFESLRFAYACRQELADRDVLYERLGWVGYGGGIASGWLKKPLVLEVNGDHIAELELLGIAPRGVQMWLSRRAMQWGIFRAAHVVAAGEGWRRRFVDRWKVPSSKISVIENGTSLVDRLNREQLRSFSNSIKITGPLQIFFIGGFEPWQGIQILIQSFAEVCQMGIDARLSIVGTGKQEAEIRSMAVNLGISEKISFLGKMAVTEYSQLICKADIGVSAYCGRVEFSGLKLLDYKAAGLAIVASGKDGDPAILSHGKTGWIVPPCDPQALRNAIIYLAKNRDLMKTLGKNARMEAEALHSWKNTAIEVAKICSAVIENSQKPVGGLGDSEKN